VVGDRFVPGSAPELFVESLQDSVVWPKGDYIPDTEHFLVTEAQRILPDVEVLAWPKPIKLPPDAVP
jgi:hypothetical protein